MASATVDAVAERVQTDTAVARLDRVGAGEVLRILAVEERSDETGCRLREMGLYEGARVEIVSAGDPVVLSLLGARIAVCRRCARHVVVQPTD